MLHTLRRHTSLVLCVAVLTVLAYATSLQSAGNSLTRVIHDAQTQTSVINITVAIDWDVDASPTPTIVIKGKAGTPLGRDYLSRIFEVAADTIYTMTEGRHRLGTVYVYSKSRKFENVDLHIENKPGHAKGNVSGLFVNGRDVGLYTTYWKEVEYGKYEEREDPSFSMGRTIGHEFGHYLYGLYDEYSGDSKYASDPQKGDADPNTIMSKHEEYANLSTSSDYAGGTKTTAQYRVYKQKSAWETLISDPKNDGELADTRVWFAAFKNMTAPTADTLKKPSDSATARAKLNIVYMGATRIALVIDRGLAQSAFDAQIAAAIQAVDKATDGSQIAIVTYVGSAAEVARELATVGGKSNDPERTAIKTCLMGLRRVESSGKGGADAALKLASALESPVARAVTLDAAAGSVIATVGATVDQPPAVLFFTHGAAEVSSDTITTLREASVAVYPVALKQGGGDGNLAALATGTSGVLGRTANLAELGSLAAIATNQGEGNRWQLLNDDEVSAMAAGSVFSLTTLLAGGAVDGETTFVASWQRGDGEKIDFTLMTPDGKAVTSANAEALGIEYARDDGEEYAEYTVPASFSGRAGRWVSTVSAAAAIGSVSQQVETESSLSARIALHGGTADDPRPPMVSVTVANPLAVKGATVTVDVYDEDGSLVQAGIPLNDRAVPPDASANDGIYSASLAGIIRSTGSYEIVANVSNPDGAAVSGFVAPGTDESALGNTPISDQFTRVASAYLSYETSATAAGDGSTCFIATAAYGSYLHPFVRILQSFRDRFLLTSTPGRVFTNWYVRTSPSIADVIRSSEPLKAGVRLLLLPLVGFGYLCITIGFLPGLGILLVSVVALYRGMSRER